MLKDTIELKYSVAVANRCKYLAENEFCMSQADSKRAYIMGYLAFASRSIKSDFMPLYEESAKLAELAGVDADIVNAIRYAGNAFISPEKQTNMWFILNWALLTTGVSGGVVTVNSKLHTIGKAENFTGPTYESVKRMAEIIRNKVKRKTFYLITAGTRKYEDWHYAQMTMHNTIEYHLKQSGLNPDEYDICIVTGGATGVDTYAKQYAKMQGYKYNEFLPDWNKGAVGGIQRTQKLFDWVSKQEGEKACLCIWDGLSRGTLHNFKIAKAHGVPLYVFNYAIQRWLTAEEIEIHIAADS